jgi:hypothetical protein
MVASGAVHDIMVASGAVHDTMVASGAVHDTMVASGAVHDIMVASGAVHDTMVASGAVHDIKLHYLVHQEADINRRLDHPNIVMTYTSGMIQQTLQASVSKVRRACRASS